MSDTQIVDDRSLLTQRFLQTRKRTESLCAPLNVEDYVPQAHDFASPPKWHLAHTTWFFEEIILRHFWPVYEVFDAAFHTLFNSYYQGLGQPAERSQRGIITRPTVAQVYAYRKHVTDHIQQLLQDNIGTQVVGLIELGINHEQQHQELLITDLKIAFSLNPSYPVYDADSCLESQQSQSGEWLSMESRIYQMGYSGSGFSFDNEHGQHRVFLEEFELAKGLVTNAEWLEFIDAGAYDNFEYWLDEGWNWVKQNAISAPKYWIKESQQWACFSLTGIQSLKADAAVAHISYYEADAYANWKGARLPTEFEWEAACANIDWGQCWEWTSSSYQAYPKFRVGEGAVGEYNGKFMANQYVLRGASKATAEGHSRPSYRNFFHPHHQWQFSGLRLAK